LVTWSFEKVYSLPLRVEEMVSSRVR
jgi:hypothetical protein